MNELSLDLAENIKRLEAIDKAHVWHPFTQMKDWAEGNPIMITEARDCFIKDIRGRWYLDGVSSLWVNILGHRRKEINEAISAQLEKAAHTTLLGLANETSTELAGRLASLMDDRFGPFTNREDKKLSRIFYSDNGSTAVEVALKMAFQYWQHKGEKERSLFVSLENGYHGDTLGAVSVGGVGIFHDTFKPLLFGGLKKPPSPYCYRCQMGLEKRYPDCGIACTGPLEELFKTRGHEIAAFILEPMVQAAGGIIIFPPGYLKKAKELCEKYGILLIADEVATGFGRTGKMFACEHEGVVPDIICLSKGITGGYMPLAVTITNNEIYGAFLGEYDELKTFFHGHSYTGNPLACRAALAVLDVFRNEKIIEKALPPKVSLLKDALRQISAHENVGEAKNLGLMGRIELVADKHGKTPFPWAEKTGWKVALHALEKGLFIRPLGNVIVIMPPLSISSENLRRMMETIHESIIHVLGG